MSERERDSVLEMIGEFLREAAVLVLVFVPLEFYKSGKALSPWWIPVVIAVSLATLTAGIAMERFRQ